MTISDTFGYTTGEVVTSDFTPPWWAKNRHVQTIFPRFFQKRQPFNPTFERLELPDGDFVDLAWGAEPQMPKGMLVFFHGLEGSIKSHYANDMMAHFERLGWLVVLMHFRGCSGELNRRTRAYHSGETLDALHVLNLLNERYPNLQKTAIGFSLGANMLLKLLGENPQQHVLKSAISVSPPMRLNECAKSIDKGFSRFYQNHLMKSMKATLRAKLAKLDYSNHPHLTEEKVADLISFRDFDQHVTAPLHGFKDADDYYQKCSAIGFLKHIQTPTLILHAADDPFMNERVIPDNSDLSAAIRYEVSDRGGHVGFLQGTPFKPQIWLHQRVQAFVEAQSEGKQ